MRPANQRVILMGILAVCLATAAWAAQGPGGTLVEKYTIQSRSLEGIFGEWTEFAREVTVTGPDITMTCDRLKIWLTPDGQRVRRAEASGNIVVRGLYLSADKTKWQIVGRASAATYEEQQGQGVLQGSVRFEATNQATGAVLKVEADRLVYDINTRAFRFESSELPVRGEWREPATKPGESEGAGDPPGGQAKSQQ